MAKAVMNSKYIDALLSITNECLEDSYIVLGSAATLSFTAKLGYVRKINDLDIIADELAANKMKNRLVNLGFEQSTFINKRMPFFNKLMKHSQSTYLRFTKGEVSIEILLTKFIKNGSNLKFDLYPNFWVKIPPNSLIKSQLGEAQFTTLDVNLLWAIKYLLHNSLGKFMRYKGKQRSEDLLNLRKLVNLDKAKKLLSQCRFGYRGLSFSIPAFFFN